MRTGGRRAPARGHVIRQVGVFEAVRQRAREAEVAELELMVRRIDEQVPGAGRLVSHTLARRV